MEFMKKSQTKPKNPIELEGYTVPTEWFEANLMPELDHDYEFIAEGNVVSGLSHLDVYNSGQLLVLWDGGNTNTVTILATKPTDRLIRAAESLRLEREGYLSV